VARPHQALLSRTQIADVALALIDREGRFTIPRLADELGVHPSSLYHHVSGRAEIVELIRDRVADSITNDRPKPTAWADYVADWIRGYRAAFAAHPHVITLLTSQTVVADHTIAMYENVALVLEDAGFASDVLPVISILESYAWGAALDLVAPEIAWTPDLPRGTPLARAIANAPIGRERADAAFEIGLALLVTGLQERLRHRQA